MSSSTIISIARTARAVAQRSAHPTRRTVVSSTKSTKKSALGAIQATNMPLNNLMSFAATSSPPPPPATSSVKPIVQSKPLSEQQQLKRSNAVVDPLKPMTFASFTESEPFKEVDMVELKRWASMAPTPLRLGDMYKYAASNDINQRIRNAQFLHRELPIRLAQRAYDLLSLPHDLSSESTPIRQVALYYIEYIRKFQAFPVPQTPEDEDRFTEMLHSMVMDRTSIPTAIAQGLNEWMGDERKGSMDMGRQQEMEDALVRFFTARVGLRFLSEHHVLSSRNPKLTGLRDDQTQFPLSTRENDRGCIQYDCNPVAECEKVATEIVRQTYDCYGICPNIEIVDRQSPKAQNFTYVPHHLHYMLAELLKNSCRASVERYMAQGGPQNKNNVIKPIKVVIVKGAKEVTIKVSDEGGGIPRSTMARIFKFTHSTSQQETEGDTDFGTVEAGIRQMRGFGLPLARIYARYFGGELTLKSMEGHGLDAYLYLPRLGDACENLPRRVERSPGQQVSLPSARWSKEKNTLSRSYSTTSPLKRVQISPEARLLEEAYKLKQTTDGDEDDPLEWEEAKIRRILKILEMRAL